MCVIEKGMSTYYYYYMVIRLRFEESQDNVDKAYLSLFICFPIDKLRRMDKRRSLLKRSS